MVFHLDKYIGCLPSAPGLSLRSTVDDTCGQGPCCSEKFKIPAFILYKEKPYLRKINHIRDSAAPDLHDHDAAAVVHPRVPGR